MNGKAPSPKKKYAFKIVPLAAEHLDPVLDIEKRVFTEPWRREDFQRLIDNQEAVCLAALDAGRVVGYSCCWVVIETAELGNIAVEPEFQGRGVARALLEATIKACRRKMAVMLFLEVRCSNLRAIELYERYGFARIGLRRGYYTHPVEDALIMKLSL